MTTILTAPKFTAIRERPRSVCPGHSRYDPACGDCREHHAAYKRWRCRAAAYGELPQKVDPGPARDHLNAVLGRHFFTPRQVAPLCGLSTSFLRHLALGNVQQITKEAEEIVLELDADDLLAEIAVGTVSSRGASRRLRALAVVGHSASSLAPLVGVPDFTVARWRRRITKTISIANHRRIAEVYRDVHNQPGPCVDTAVKARQWKYAPPICWDDDRHIDDPAGRPREFSAWLRLNPDPRTLAGAA